MRIIGYFVLWLVLAGVGFCWSEGGGEPRIIGGYQIPITDAPYQVAILYRYTFSCGGVIIAHVWVLTAGHCVTYQDGQVIRHQAFAVRLGTNDANVQVEQHTVNAVFLHPSYRADQLDYDVGMLQLSARLEFSDTIRCINMAEKFDPVPYKQIVTVTGYGATDPKQVPKDAFLRAVQVEVVPETYCQVLYGNDPYYVTARMFCAASKGKDSCRFDSGSAAVYNNTVIGLVSHGRGCADINKPGIYTRIAAVRPWIDDILWDNSIRTPRPSNGRCNEPFMG